MSLTSFISGGCNYCDMKLYWYSSVPFTQMNMTWQHTVLPSDSVTDVKTHLFT